MKENVKKVLDFNGDLHVESAASRQEVSRIIAARIERELEREYAHVTVKKHQGKVRLEMVRVEDFVTR